MANSRKKQFFLKAFTLIEIMLVIILIGIIATFAVPNYRKAVLKTHERDAKLQLMSIHAANLIYKSNTTEYLNTGGQQIGINDINDRLGINIIANEKIYSYTSNGSTYTAEAAYTSGNDTFTIRITQDSVDDLNPCCAAGSCPTLPPCS